MGCLSRKGTDVGSDLYKRTYVRINPATYIQTPTPSLFSWLYKIIKKKKIKKTSKSRKNYHSHRCNFVKDELKKRNAKGFSSKNKAELIKQLEENLSMRKYEICSILGAWNDFSYSKGDSLTHSKLYEQTHMKSYVTSKGCSENTSTWQNYNYN